MRCALGYDMGPGARPVIHPVTAPRNRASEYLIFGRFWGPKGSNLSKYVLNLCRSIIAAVDQAFLGC